MLKCYKLLQGFTKDGQPVLPNVLQVLGRFELARSAWILAPRTLFIHFYLASIVSRFHTSIIPQSIADYFPRGGLDVWDVPFKFGTAEAAEEYACRAESLMSDRKGEYERVVWVLTDHSDEDEGDLFIGPDEAGVVASASIDQVSFRTFACFCNADVRCSSFVNSLRHSRRLYGAVYRILPLVVPL